MTVIEIEIRSHVRGRRQAAPRRFRGSGGPAKGGRTRPGAAVHAFGPGLEAAGDFAGGTKKALPAVRRNGPKSLLFKGGDGGTEPLGWACGSSSSMTKSTKGRGFCDSGGAGEEGGMNVI